MSRRLAAAIAVSLLVVGCGANDNGGAVGTRSGAARSASTVAAGAFRGQLPARMASSGEIRVGLLSDAAPLASGTGPQSAGLEPDLARALGRALGVSVSFIDAPPLTSAVAAGRVDLALAGLVDTPASRAGGVDFVDYLDGAARLLVRKGNPGRVGSIDDLCGRTVGVVSGSAGEAAAQRRQAACSGRGRPPIALHVSSRHSDLVSQLGSNQIVAILDDALVANYSAQSSTAPAELQTIGDPADPVIEGIAVAKGNSALGDAVRAALNALIDDGTYAGILGRWGAAGEALTSVTVNGSPA